jgi:hypothetical protein
LKPKERPTVPPNDQTPPLRPPSLAAIYAHHEAGHALVAWHFQLPMGYLFASEDDGFFRHKNPLQFIHLGPEMGPRERDLVDKVAQLLLGGEMAERLFDPGSGVDFEGGDDRLEINFMASRLYPDSQVHAMAWIADIERQAETIVREHWHALKALAETLRERQRLSGRQAMEILDGARAPSGN